MGNVVNVAPIFRGIVKMKEKDGLYKNSIQFSLLFSENERLFSDYSKLLKLQIKNKAACIKSK